MAALRHAAVTVAAVVLLLCLSRALAADADASKQVAAEQSTTPEAQHAPQFPEDPVLRRQRGDKGKQSDKPASTPTDSLTDLKALKQLAKEAPVKATPVPDSKKASTPTQEPKKEEPKKEETKKEEEKEDPCKRVPGCMQCKPAEQSGANTLKGASRRLKQSSSDADWNMGALGSVGNPSSGSKTNKPQFNLMDLVDSPYNAKDLPMCTLCNTTAGYVAHSQGRCACAPGYGDTNPTGTCNRCPGGFMSVGGFRAICKECEGVAFSNSDHTACVCASGWYGITSFVTKQASCNQCPGARPVSAEGARSSTECRACPEGQQPNEIFSDCVDPNKIPEPVAAPDIPDTNSNETVEVQPLFNETTFQDTAKDWTITTRNTQNHSNIFTDFLGSIMDSVVMGKNVTATARSPGELLYQVLTKPAPAAPKLPTMPNIDLQNPQQLGAGFGAALTAVPKVLGSAAQNGGKISDVVDNVVKAVETGSQNVEAADAGNGWDAFIKGLSSTAPKDTTGTSQVADFAKSLGDLFGAAGKVATEMAEKSDNSLVKTVSSFLSAAKKGDMEAPLTPESALVGSSESVDANSGFGDLLSGMLGSPAPAAGSSAGGLVDSATTPSADAAAPSNPISSADITKMLASLTAPSAKVKDPNPPTITASGVRYVPEGQLSSSDVLPNAPSSEGNLLKAVSQLSGGKTDSSNVGGDLHESSTSIGQRSGLGSLLGGLFGGQKSSNTLSLGNQEGRKFAAGKIQNQAATTPADGFIAVPSAPPKGSSDIKSGKIGAWAKLMGKHAV